MHKVWRPSVMLPHLVDGKWRNPKMRPRQVALLRKTAMLEDKVKLDADYTKGEWDPRWEQLRKPNLLKPPRGRLGLRKRPEKMEKIKQALLGMDDMIKARSKKGTTPQTFIEKILLREGVVQTEAQKKKSNKKK